MEKSFKIDFYKDQRTDNIIFYGNIDSESAQPFSEIHQKISADHVVMDFSNVGRINSMGISILLSSIKSIKTEKNAEVSIKGLNQINAIMFKLTGIFQLATHG